MEHMIVLLVLPPINYNGVLYYEQIMITYSYEKVNCKYGHCILWFPNRVDEHINFNSYSYQMVLLFLCKTIVPSQLWSALDCK